MFGLKEKVGKSSLQNKHSLNCKCITARTNIYIYISKIPIPKQLDLRSLALEA
uniref:Uncharacterized protein n=1 Tax=Nelumbo nucifera TaxID=4432 RepID=A0A822XH15_NELNU|nr:TPA_asm: hypothetical protein HUJ06_020980 [Nelumbo nucifera]